LFESSSDSGSERRGTISQKGLNDEDEDDDYVEGSDGEDDDQEEEVMTERASRSAFTGRGNVQAVRAARKKAGLSESFGQRDPLIAEFASFMQAS